MAREEIDRFPSEVAEKLAFYVYRLIDPRNGDTFYVGKGQGDRVFAHVRGEPVAGDEMSDKLKRINEIRCAGLSVGHVIHRHGMNEETAVEVEAALIDAFPGLTNLLLGAGSNDCGVMHVHEIVTRYSSEPACFDGTRVLLIIVNRSAVEADSLYEATRYCWRIDKCRAEQAEIILAVRHGLIIGAFVAQRWLEATAANFPGRNPVPGRFGFEGREATEEIKRRYLGKRVPDQFRKRGAAGPIRYTWEPL